MRKELEANSTLSPDRIFSKIGAGGRTQIISPTPILKLASEKETLQWLEKVYEDRDVFDGLG